jgi:hypothetical protein
MLRTTGPRQLRSRSGRSLGDGRNSTRYLAAAAAIPLLLFGVQADLGPNDPWEGHTIIEGSAGSGNYSGADGVDIADVDADGDLDVVSAFEAGHRIGIGLNPTFSPSGPGDVEDVWDEVKLPTNGDRILGPEDAIFADIDGSGALDVIVASQSDRMVVVMFGPGNPDHAADPAAWTRMTIEESVDREAAMRLQFADMNGDSVKDIVVGAREIHTSGGLGYYTSSDPTQADSWTYNPITPVGWVQEMQVVDMNGDPHPDIIYSDRDPIKTPDDPDDDNDPTRRGLRWLENPGVGGGEWQARQITPVEPLHKWFTLVDWDADGDNDVIDCRSNPENPTVHETAIWLRGPGNPPSWTKLPVPIPSDVGFCQHATAVEIDNAGAGAGLDLAFTYSHAGDALDDSPSGVVWLKNTGTKASPVWQRNEISGAPGIKYDNLIWIDLDEDGDKDALTSEQHVPNPNANGPGLGVIWYENPTNNP